ncbi:MAG TPA: tetratricopeptide repeat protein [Thermoanaerobaculia bacterium]|nr:tetratricopeptide repeat protein [Thermoanaerobaculia bacterium]
MSTSRSTFLYLLLSCLPSLLAAQPADVSPEHDFIMARLAAHGGEYDTALRLMDRVLRKSPGDPVLLFERASMLVDAQRFPRAESELRKLVEREPDFYDANRLLGRLLLDRSGGSPGRIEEALLYLKSAYRIMPDDLASGLTVAQILVATERFDEAAGILATVVERAPDNRTANYSYAQVLTRLGRSDESRVYLERAVAADPTFAPAIFQLVDIYQKSREWLKAAELLQPLLEDDPLNDDLQRQQAFFFLRGGEPAEAKRILEPLVAADGRDERSRFFLAEALAELEQFPEAEAIYRQLLEHDPDNVDFLVSFGLTQMGNRDFAGAAKTFDRLLGIESANEPIRRLARTQLAAIAHHEADYEQSLQQALAVLDGSERLNHQGINIALDIYRRQQRWSEAVELLDRMISTFGEEPFLFARRLEFLLYADRMAEAAEVAEKLRAAESGRLMVAEVYVQAKKFPEAIELLELLRTEKPREITLLFQLGAVLERVGRYEESEAEFESVLALDPDHAPTLNYLGYMWADRGVNLDRAAVMLEKAVGIEPKNGAYLDSLGWVYFRLGRLELAEKYLVRAAEVVPDDPTIQEHLGDLYRKQGDSDRALDFYRTALGLDPEPKELEGLKVKIAELEKRN